jgi:hypothetical protein
MNSSLGGKKQKKLSMSSDFDGPFTTIIYLMFVFVFLKIVIVVIPYWECSKLYGTR